MKNKKLKSNSYDVALVVLYRIGIVLACIAILLGIYYTKNYIFQNNNENSFIIKDLKAFNTIFWTFIIAIGVSSLSIHLYDKNILRLIQGAYFISISILLYLFYKLNFDEVLFIKTLISNNEFNGRLGIFGAGLSVFSFSCITSKEAFCFKLYEGYIMAILMAIIVFIHFLNIASVDYKWILMLVLGVISFIFCIRKVMLPFKYDIGEKE